MPEMPEVETIRRGLEKYLVGQRAQYVEVRLPKIVKNEISFFTETLTQNPIQKLERRGKLLIVRFLDSPYSLIIHLRMTGQLIYRNGKEQVAGGHPFPNYNGELPNKFTHLILGFEFGTVYFNDQRQFGFAKIVDEQELTKIVEPFGIEPLSPEFTFDNFAQQFTSTNRSVKAILLDQHHMSGLGNIYADEVCFHSGVLPQRTVNSLSLTELKKLYENCEKVLANAIEKRGTTMSDYVDANGQHGNYADFLMVYGRGGKPCLQCGTTITKIKHAGRGTHFCSVCQR